MSLTIKLDFSKLLKLSHLKSWDHSAVISVFTELTKRIPTELMNASNLAFFKEAAPNGMSWQTRSPQYVKLSPSPATCARVGRFLTLARRQG